MAFQKGNPGRPKGSKNKFKLTTIREALQAMEIDLGPHILREIVEIQNPETRVTLLMRLYAWVEPRTSKIIQEGGADSESTDARPKGQVVDDLIQALTRSIKQKDGSTLNR